VKRLRALQNPQPQLRAERALLCVEQHRGAPRGSDTHTFCPRVYAGPQFERMNTIARESVRLQKEKVAHAKAAFNHKWFNGPAPQEPGAGHH